MHPLTELVYSSRNEPFEELGSSDSLMHGIPVLNLKCDRGKLFGSLLTESARSPLASGERLTAVIGHSEVSGVQITCSCLF